MISVVAGNVVFDPEAYQLCPAGVCTCSLQLESVRAS